MYLGAIQTKMYSGEKRVYYKRFIGVLLLGVFIVFGFISNSPAHAATGINQQLNFQGRLLNAQGATVPDGYYNMQFKIYQDGDGQSVGDTTGAPTGVLDWTETYLNANSSQGVMVKNGYMSVNLGSITPFGNNVNWNQSTLWLSVNIGNTNTSCTPFASCVPDGEMVPMKRLSSTPYALNSGLLNGLSSTNFIQLAQGVQTDATTNTNSIYINKTGTGNIIDLQTSGTDAFMVSNVGDLTFGNNANHNLSVATAAAGTAGNSLTIASGAGGTGAGTESGGNLLLQGGAAGGTNSTGGNVNIDAGAKSGSGADGNINIGTSHASTIQIGSTTLATGTQTVNIGNNNTAGGTTNVTVGSGSSAGGTTTVQANGNVNVTSSNGNVGVTATTGTVGVSSGGNTTLTTNSVVRATIDTSNDIYFGNGVTAAAPNNFTVSGTGSTTTAVAGGAIAIQGGAATVGNANGGNLSLNAGALVGSGTDGSLNIGNLHASTIQIGNATLATGTQTINIGNDNTSGGTSNVTIGAGGSATGGTTAIQSKANTTFSTNGVVRSTFDTSNDLYLGNGVTAAAPNNFTISGTGSTTTAVAGGAIAIQGGAATVGNANGGNVSIDAGALFGTGADGLINIGTNHASTIQIGSTTLATGTQTVNVGNNNTSGSTTNVTVGSGSSATAGTTTVQGKGNVNVTSSAGNIGVTATTGTVGLSSGGNTTLTTNSVVRATIDTANDIYFGNGVTAAAPNNFTVSGTGSTTTAVAGGAIAIQGGAATVGNANGGNLNLNAGALVGTGTDGTINIGNTHASTIQIGNATLATGTQTINIGNDNTAGGTANVTIGAGGTAAGGTTAIQSKANTTFSTNGVVRGTFDTSNDLYLGNGVTATAPNNFSIIGTGSTTTAVAGGAIAIQGGAATVGNANGGNVSIDAGALIGTGTDGLINIGTNHASTIQIGNTTGAITQNVNIGNNNTANSTTNVVIGSGSSALAASTTTIQAKGNVNVNSASGNVGVTATAGTISLSSLGSTTISTNGVARATLDNAGDLYFGNGVTAAAPTNFSIQGTGSSTTAVTGGAITIQGGNATVGNANGGNITLSGGTGYGTGVNGLVILTNPTFSTTANDANCYTGGALVATSCTMAASSVNNSSAVIVGFSTAGQTATMPDPTNVTAGRVVYVTAANGSNDFTLSVNGGGTGNTIAMRQNTTATMIWNGNDWTAAGASSSTTLQSAYNNTLQSAGGAELVVSHTSNTNGLTIRDSLTNPVNGTLLSVQTASASWLLSVNDAVTEYSTDGGAETAGGTSSTFPASTWAYNGSATQTFSRYATTGNYIATGQASVADTTTATANDGVKDTLSSALTANMHYNVSFTARLSSGIFTDMNVYYSVDGTTASVACLTSKAIETSVWTKVNCSFTAPASGITASNAILIRQTTGVIHTFYVDNLSVTIAANYSYDTDGGVDNAGSFSTNWPFVSATSGVGTTTRNTSDGQAASDSAGVTLTTGAANAGISNKLSMNPLPNTLYEITAYAKLSTGTFNDFTIRYTRDGSTGSSGNYVNCVDYSTQVVTTTGWTQITCYVTTDGTAATNPYVDFVEGSAVARTYYVDSFSMTLSTNTTPNVQIGGGVNGGPVTLLTLDQAASAPIASNNASLLGSMYYDTTLGKLQCYEADGWGACGSSGDTIVTISPEYTNAVMHGTGVGTMTSDICSGALDINDGSSGQPTVCAATETYNFYKWTSPQASAQTYGIYVTYQLPSTFKSFDSGQTSIMGRTDSANSTVQYQIYRNDSVAGLVACGSTVSVSTGSVAAWQIGVASGAADPSTCGFIAGNSIVFKISAIASQNANAYVSNLNFAFSNK